MKRIALLLILALPLSQSWSQTKGELILSELRTQVGPTQVPTTPTPTTFLTQDALPTPTPTPTLSQGESKVQEMLQKNRERLKALREGKQTPTPAPKQSTDRAAELRARYENRAQAKRDAFNERAREIRQRWAKKRQEFLKNVDQYKAQTYSLEDLVNVGSAAKPFEYKGKSLLIKGHNYSLSGPETVIKGALELTVRDQGKRPTCAAFAAVRALEVLDLKAKTKNPREFSEQFFYYASKPKCQQSPCEGRGSWVTSGLDYLKVSPMPLASQCPYSPQSVDGNQTQIPLAQKCFEGERLNIKYQSLTSLDQLAGVVTKQHPIIVGVRLTPSFYQTKGLVLHSQAERMGAMDEHAQGHALVIVGMIPLPEDVKIKEGNYCYIVANSWGEGWGIGGHACVSRKWLEHQLVPRALVALEQI